MTLENQALMSKLAELQAAATTQPTATQQVVATDSSLTPSTATAPASPVASAAPPMPSTSAQPTAPTATTPSGPAAPLIPAAGQTSASPTSDTPPANPPASPFPSNDNYLRYKDNLVWYSPNSRTEPDISSPLMMIIQSVGESEAQGTRGGRKVTLSFQRSEKVTCKDKRGNPQEVTIFHLKVHYNGRSTQAWSRSHIVRCLKSALKESMPPAAVHSTVRQLSYSAASQGLGSHQLPSVPIQTATTLASQTQHQQQQQIVGQQPVQTGYVLATQFLDNPQQFSAPFQQSSQQPPIQQQVFQQLSDLVNQLTQQFSSPTLSQQPSVQQSQTPIWLNTPKGLLPFFLPCTGM